MTKRWAKVTAADVLEIAGRRDALLGKIQDRYAIARFDAEKQLNTWTDAVLLCLDETATSAQWP